MTAALALRRQLRVTGLVQGVGFRPFVYRIASEHLLGGWVRNDRRGVTICVEGPPAALDIFVADLHTRLPELARIDSCILLSETVLPDWSSSFQIVATADDAGAGVLITPDAHVCSACLAELVDPGDRRFGYPLINCTNCGPRYSIIRDVPYDRPNTTMAGFQMCSSCRTEYESPGSRRLHAQPISCWSCGPQVSLLAMDGSVLPVTDPVQAAVELLRDGRILAVKAQGGYQLMVDAADHAAVASLRTRKERGPKPFALLAVDAETVSRHCHLDERERGLLTSTARPIVLLRQRAGSPLSQEIAPGSRSLGFMLPATPLQYLLLHGAGPVLVATSGNAPDEPMARTDQEALRDLAGIADFVLAHSREIHVRVDDSIARIVPSRVRPKVTVLRRGRGLAPDPIPAPFPVPPLLALGAELKNTVCVGSGLALYGSQHIGDLQGSGNQRFFAEVIAHLTTKFSIEPRYVAHDLHPDFHSTRFAAGCTGAESIAVQHHHAHLAACMADNGLDRPVIGVIFDGTGYGTDGTIWGGEFLIGDYHSAHRAGHLAHFRLPGGDRAVQEPWRVAVGLLGRHWGPAAAELPLAVIGNRDPFAVELILKMADRGLNSPVTSSMGRLFDAVSAILGVCEVSQYEAQAAIELEALIDDYDSPLDPWPLRLGKLDGRTVIEHEPWLRALVSDLLDNRLSAAQVSRRLHDSVVRATKEICLELSLAYGISDIVLSGGVFLNMYLLVRIEQELSEAGLRVHTHNRVPTSDGGLALGQAMVAAARVRERTTAELSVAGG